MNKMYKSDFIKFCQKENLDMDLFGFSYTNKTNGDRYRGKRDKNNTNERWFVISANDIGYFLVWDLESVKMPIREIYTVKKAVVKSLTKNYVIKAVEYPNRQNEKVYIIKPSELKELVSKVNCPASCKELS